MKTHTTNYTDTFIEVAADCPVSHAETPPEKKEKTLANLQFDMISNHPYKYTSDDVIFNCFAVKKDVPASELNQARKAFFSKGQPCMRCSPLTKRYGFGVHHNQEGKMALYPVESKEYKKFVSDKKLKQVKAMSSKKEIGHLS